MTKTAVETSNITHCGSRLAITQSILSPHALETELNENYAIGAPGNCRFWRHGCNDTYLLTSDGQNYVARIYRVGRRSLSEIRYELEVLRHLFSRGIAVSLPLPGTDGSLIRYLQAPEGPRPLVLFSYLQGQPAEWQSERHYFLAGILAARIHAGSNDFVSEQFREPMNFFNLIEKPLTALKPFLDSRRDDWDYVDDLAGRLWDWIAANAKALDWGLCHGDFNFKNIHVSNDGAAGIFDFDQCGPGWRAWDLAEFWRLGQRKYVALWDAFLSGYETVRPLASADLCALPVFHLLVRLWSGGDRAAQVYHLGTSRMSYDYIDRFLRTLREGESYLDRAAGRV